MSYTREYSFLSLEARGDQFMITVERTAMSCCRVLKRQPIKREFVGDLGSWVSYPEGKLVSKAMHLWLDATLTKHK